MTTGRSTVRPPRSSCYTSGTRSNSGTGQPSSVDRRRRGMSAPGETDGPVTVLVARRVLPGKEVEFETWASELTRAASGFDGFLGAGLLRPGDLGGVVAWGVQVGPAEA